MKVIVSEFFIGQLFLAAELCLDRNYSVISLLEKRYPLDVLLTIIKCNCNQLLKGAAARLLMTLHVDRHPQLSLTLPRLTRTYSQVESNAAVAMNNSTAIVDIEMKNPNCFMLVQLIIADSLRQIKGRPFGNHSVYLIELLQKLVEFNFYNSVDKLKDVIDPVMSAMSRRNVDYEKSEITQTVVGARKMSLKQTSGKSTKRLSLMQRQQSSAKLDNEGLVGAKDNSGEEMSPLLDGKEGYTRNLEHTWQFTVFTFLESIPSICFILCLVIASVCIALYEFLTGKGNSIGFLAFQYLLTIIFTSEVSMRGYTFYYLNGVIKPFLTSPLNIIDITVVSLDYVRHGAIIRQCKGIYESIKTFAFSAFSSFSKGC